MSITPDDVDAVPLLDEAAAQLQPMLAAAGVQLRVATPDECCCVVRADPARLRQVLLNLLTNAVKYNRAGGEVQVTVTRRTADTVQGERVEIAVADTGLGMTDTQVAALFQPFNRLGREATSIEGTGMGLVIARSLTELMDGRIAVSSQPGVGSTFVVDMPASQRAAPLPAAVADSQARVQRRDDVRGHVLYVDDNEINRILMETCLQWRPNVVLSQAADGEEGLRCALAATPDLILMDLQLPGMDGFGVLRALRARPSLRHTPCLVVSASAMPEEILRARAEGFDGYLTKPIALGPLLAEIDQRLGQGRPAPC